jgi:DNA-binding MarR family transcriptional regulator
MIVDSGQPDVNPAAEPRARVNPGFEAEWPGSRALSTECVINLFVLADEVGRRVTRWCREHGIPSIAALNALEIIRGEGQPVAPSTIADRMLVTRGAMTGIVRTLEQRRMIRRIPHPHDARSHLIDITPGGRRTLERFLALLHRADRRFVETLSPDEQTQLLGLIARLQASLPDGTLDQVASSYAPEAIQAVAAPPSPPRPGGESR